MAKLLHIDTAGEKAFVAISVDNTILGIEENETANTHANFVQQAIADICTTNDFLLTNLDAIVVTLGPGSYTGLRVGLASAKGIAYTINKPLIGLSTLKLLAHTAIRKEASLQHNSNAQIFTMIDARRMEVFGALFNTHEGNILPEQAIILDKLYLEELIKKGPVYCIGSGSTKTKQILTHPALHFIDKHYDPLDSLQLATSKLQKKDFEDIAYSAPTYIKDFYMPK